MRLTEFCRKNWKSFLSQWHCNLIYLLLLTCWCRDPCLRWSDLWDLEIFRDFLEFSTIFTVSSSGQSLSTNHLSKCQSHQQFCNQYKQTAWVQTVWILTKRLCQIESSSQQNLILSIFQVYQQKFFCHHFKWWRVMTS